MKAFVPWEKQITKAQACSAALEPLTPGFSGQENATMRPQWRSRSPGKSRRCFCLPCLRSTTYWDTSTNPELQRRGTTKSDNHLTSEEAMRTQLWVTQELGEGPAAPRGLARSAAPAQRGPGHGPIPIPISTSVPLSPAARTGAAPAAPRMLPRAAHSRPPSPRNCPTCPPPRRSFPFPGCRAELAGAAPAPGRRPSPGSAIPPLSPDCTGPHAQRCLSPPEGFARRTPGPYHSQGRQGASAPLGREPWQGTTDVWRSLRIFLKTLSFSVNLGEAPTEDSILHPFFRVVQLHPPLLRNAHGRPRWREARGGRKCRRRRGPASVAGEGSPAGPIFSSPWATSTSRSRPPTGRWGYQDEIL